MDKPLREILSDGPIPTKKLLNTSTQNADGLAKACAAGIVHRDLKSGTIMVTRDGFVKLCRGNTFEGGRQHLIPPKEPQSG